MALAKSFLWDKLWVPYLRRPWELTLAALIFLSVRILGCVPQKHGSRGVPLRAGLSEGILASVDISSGRIKTF